MAMAVPDPAVLVFVVDPLLLYAVETARLRTVLVGTMVRLEVVDLVYTAKTLTAALNVRDD